MSDNGGLSDIRTRIAKALQARDEVATAGIDDPFLVEHASYDELADAVIAELRLTRVTRSQNPPIHRWVTDWKPDDE